MKIVCLQYFSYLFLASFALDKDSNTTLDDDAAIQYFSQQKEHIKNTTQFQISENWTSPFVYNTTRKTFTLTSVNETDSPRNYDNSSALVGYKEGVEITENKPERLKKDEIQEYKRIRLNSNASKNNSVKQTGCKKKLPDSFYLSDESISDLNNKTAPKVRQLPTYFNEAFKKIQERNLSLNHPESLAEDNFHKIPHEAISNKKLKFKSYCPRVILCKIQAIKSNAVQIYRTISEEGMNSLVSNEHRQLISLYITNITQFTASYFVTLTVLKILGSILKMFNQLLCPKIQ